MNGPMLAKDVLAEVPGQICGFMKYANMKPNLRQQPMFATNNTTAVQGKAMFQNVINSTSTVQPPQPPMTSAVPVSTGGMGSLDSVLQQIGLVQFKQGLNSLGVESVNDISLLTEQDFSNIGMNTIQIRKLQRVANGQSATPSMKQAATVVSAVNAFGSGSGQAASATIVRPPNNQRNPMQPTKSQGTYL